MIRRYLTLSWVIRQGWDWSISSLSKSLYMEVPPASRKDNAVGYPVYWSGSPDPLGSWCKVLCQKYFCPSLSGSSNASIVWELILRAYITLLVLLLGMESYLLSEHSLPIFSTVKKCYSLRDMKRVCLILHWARAVPETRWLALFFSFCSKHFWIFGSWEF